jgi:predicted nucleic acid-binding protein
VSRIVLLDGGPLSILTSPRAKPSDVMKSHADQLQRLLAARVRVLVPEIVDYELRRELLRAGKLPGVARLDALADDIGYLPLNTAMMRRAAELWAIARNEGRPTAPDLALDADVILAAQALLAAEDGFEVIVATSNPGHLARYVDARPFEAIDPGPG